jgi:hypothetical protein
MSKKPNFLSSFSLLLPSVLQKDVPVTAGHSTYLGDFFSNSIL